MSLKIAFLQLMPEKTLADQLDKGIKACKEAKAKGADIALFPEMWSDGYRIPQDPEMLNQMAIRKDSLFVQAFAALAVELEMAVGITFLEEHEPGPLNSVVFYDRRGREILHYSKVHICAFDDEKVLSGGEDFYTADLEYEGGTVRIGSMICFDREFPESARILMLKGAECILVPNACPMEINRLSQLRGRAYENMLAIATCNYPEGKPDCNGHSSVFDGVAYLPEEPCSRDMEVFEAPGGEGIYFAEIDIDLLRGYRKREVHGNAYRHPDKYGLLIEKEIREPFIREDYRP